MRRRYSAAAIAIVATQACFIHSAFAQQGAAVAIGKVTDASTKKPVPDVLVTLSSPSLQGEQAVVTDASGQYRIPALPSGEYTLRLDKESFKPYSRGKIVLRADSTIRVDAELLPEALTEEVVVVARAPTIDVGSSSTGMSINTDVTRRVSISPPTSKGAAARSFESVAELTPGAQTDGVGVSINGASSLENAYVVDGLSTNNPGFNDNGSPLSVEFVKEVNVITGGYMPEYGRSTGGILNVVTKSGSNAFHGSVWSNYSPGFLEGARNKINVEGTTIQTAKSLYGLGDVGLDVGGPIFKDKLWFYVGVQASRTVYNLERSLNEIQIGPDGKPIKDPATGFTQTSRIPGSEKTYKANATTGQFFGKLTYTVNADNRVSVSFAALPSTRGGHGNFGMDPRYDTPEVSNINGNPLALAHKYTLLPIDTVVKWTSEFDSKNVLLDTTVGWHHETRSYGEAADGSELGSASGLAGVAQTTWLRNNPGYHSIADFEAAPPGGWHCEPAGTTAAVVCPVSSYTTGGSGGSGIQQFDRFQFRTVVTVFKVWLGHHTLKAGADLEYTKFSEHFTNSGGQLFQESSDGTAFLDRVRAYLRGPDQPVRQPIQGWAVHGVTAGGFVQDSWAIMDKVTLNVGARYDGEFMFAGDGTPSLFLPKEISPRVGVIYDPTQAGRSKLFANYGRFFESVPLLVASSGTSGNPRIDTNVRTSGCDPRNPAQQTTSCNQDSARLVSGKTFTPTQLWRPQVGGREPIDPDIKPQSSDEIVLGGEYDLFWGTRAGVTYTKRWINYIIDEFSRNEGLTFAMGNPGFSAAADFPKPVRDYDALTVYWMKAFADDWYAQFSYTLSSLRGNYFGLFNPVNNFVLPNWSKSYASTSLTVNQTGALPGDHTHAFKLFGGKDFKLTSSLEMNLGASFRARSGEPTSYLGAHPVYGLDTVYLIPRGSGDRLPWNFGADTHVGFGTRLDKDHAMMFTLDVFNILNLQADILRDQRYTIDKATPIANGGTDQLANVKNTSGMPIAKWPNYGHATAYQEPREFRFGLRATF